MKHQWFLVSLAAPVLAVLTCLALVGCEGAAQNAFRPKVVVPSVELPALFGLVEGSPDPSDLENGACYRALVRNASDTVLTVKQYANGAVIVPKPGARTTGLCVDVHGTHRISFSGPMLDAVTRYGLGRFAGTIHDSSDTAKVVFARGSMSVFTGTLTPGRVSNAAPCVAGLLQSVTLRDVSIESRFRGVSHREEITIDGASLWAIYRHAWHNTNPIERSSEHDQLGTFSRRIVSNDDATASLTKYVFAKADVSHMESPGNESIRMGPRGALAIASCEREVASPRLDYRCVGL